MSIGSVLTQRIREMLGMRPTDPPINAEAGLNLIAAKFLALHSEAVTCRAALTMLALMVNGAPPEKPEERPYLESLLCGIAWDFGAMGGNMADLDHVFQKLEAPRVQPVQSNLVRLH